MATFNVTDNGVLRVQTHRSGPMVFQIGLDLDALEHFRVLAEHAYARFASMPKIPDITRQFEKLVLVTSIHSTDTIEGGDLTEKETSEILEVAPVTALKEADQRVINLKAAYQLADRFSAIVREEMEDTAGPFGSANRIPVEFSEKMILDLHQIITAGLSHKDNVPGHYRNNPKHRKTTVGSPDHGGIYTPPKCLDDIRLLMDTFVAWVNSKPVMNLDPLYRAPLIHYYFERIHPFWDGNGRVGRVLEAITLQAAGFVHFPYALCRYYLDHIHTYYTLFNACRTAEKKDSYPNTEFVRFHLVAAINTINRLHDWANAIVAALLFDSHTHQLALRKAINDRQHAILDQLSQNPELGLNGHLLVQPWYNALYKKLTPRTKMRDLKKLEDLGLIQRSKDGAIHIAYARPEMKLASSSITTVSF